MAWGIVAFYFLAAIQITSWLMRHMKRKIWHAIHLSSIALWISATVHTFLAGQDRHNTLLQWFVLGSTILVLQLTLFRLVTLRSAQKWALRPETPAKRSRPGQHRLDSASHGLPHQVEGGLGTSQSMLCVGLDPDPARLPASFEHVHQAIYQFCKAIVDATAHTVCAFKPQFAYFAAQRAEPELERLCQYIRDTYPDCAADPRRQARRHRPDRRAVRP